MNNEFSCKCGKSNGDEEELYFHLLDVGCDPEKLEAMKQAYLEECELDE